jgi:preprotein translocase subunit SecG
LQQYICECNQYKTGGACQSDSRPCSSNPCLNNATCLNVINQMNQSKFQCNCSNPNLYYGIFCENKFDLCQNSSVCFNNQGYCVVNDTQPMCKCLMGYSGVNCEILSSALSAKKVITKTTTIIAIVVMGLFILLVIFFDYTKYFLMKNKKSIKKNKTELKHEIKHFYYKP